MDAYENLTGVAVFVKVVESGSFAAAALRLNLSRSSVSKAISRLEQRLGVQLLHRTTRTQSLTEDGQLFYERCLRAVEEIRTGMAMLDSWRTSVQGKLRISVPILFGRHCVAPVLLELVRKYPDLELEMDFDERHVNVVEEGFDFVVRTSPAWSDAELKLVSKKLATQRMVICASPDYLKNHGVPSQLADISGHRAIAYCRLSVVREWRFIGDHAVPVIITPPAHLRLNNYEAIAEAASAGFGLACMPFWLIRERIFAGELVQVLENQQLHSFEYYALWPQTRHLPLRVRIALDELARRLPGMV